jgi:uncharacterized membrane protein
VSFYELLLLLHVLSAFVLVSAIVLLWTMVAVAWRSAADDTEVVRGTLARPAGILVSAGAMLALVFGVWLAIYVDGYELWDGWILASLLLWLLAVGTGERGGRVLGPPGALADPAARRRGVALQLASSAATLAILVLMIFKPGA